MQETVQSEASATPVNPESVQVNTVQVSVSASTRKSILRDKNKEVQRPKKFDMRAWMKRAQSAKVQDRNRTGFAARPSSEADL